MLILLVILLILLVYNSRTAKPYKCSPWKECPHCHGTGIIQLDGDDTIECYCVTEWK